MLESLLGFTVLLMLPLQTLKIIGGAVDALFMNTVEVSVAILRSLGRVLRLCVVMAVACILSNSVLIFDPSPPYAAL